LIVIAAIFEWVDKKIKIKWAHVPVNIFQSARRKPFFARQKRLTALSRKIFLSTEVDKKFEFGGGLWGIVVLSTEVDKKSTTARSRFTITVLARPILVFFFGHQGKRGNIKGRNSSKRKYLEPIL